MTPIQLREHTRSNPLEELTGFCVAIGLATARGDEERLTELARELVDADEAKVIAGFEVVLQTHLFAGFPKTIFALRLFQKLGVSVPDGLKDEREESAVLSDGEALCSQIYGNAYERLREMMASLHPEFDQWMVMTGYGRVLSRRGLEARQRELAVLPVLADQRAWPQLESHAAGAVRCGASSGDVLTSLGLWSVSVSDQMSVIALEHVERALARVA